MGPFNNQNKAKMKSWREIFKASKRRFVAVTGYEPYFVSKIKEWWQEEYPQALPIDPGGIITLSPKTKFDGNYFVAGGFKESKHLLKDIFTQAFRSKDSGLLVFCRGRLDPVDLKWFQMQASIRFGFILLRTHGIFDRRKNRWARDICNQMGLIVDSRAIDHLLDYCGRDLLMFEAEVWKLKSLVPEGNKIVGHNFILAHYPIPERVSDLDRLASCADAGYQDFFSALVGLPPQQQVYRIRKLSEQIRLGLVFKKEEITPEDLERIRKTTDRPMSLGQVKRVMNRCKLTDEQRLRFLSMANRRLLSLANI